MNAYGGQKSIARCLVAAHATRRMVRWTLVLGVLALPSVARAGGGELPIPGLHPIQFGPFPHHIGPNGGSLYFPDGDGVLRNSCYTDFLRQNSQNVGFYAAHGAPSGLSTSVKAPVNRALTKQYLDLIIVPDMAARQVGFLGTCFGACPGPDGAPSLAMQAAARTGKPFLGPVAHFVPAHPANCTVSSSNWVTGDQYLPTQQFLRCLPNGAVEYVSPEELKALVGLEVSFLPPSFADPPLAEISNLIARSPGDNLALASFFSDDGGWMVPISSRMIKNSALQLKYQTARAVRAVTGTGCYVTSGLGVLNGGVMAYEGYHNYNRAVSCGGANVAGGVGEALFLGLGEVVPTGVSSCANDYYRRPIVRRLIKIERGINRGDMVDPSTGLVYGSGCRFPERYRSFRDWWMGYQIQLGSPTGTTEPWEHHF